MHTVTFVLHAASYEQVLSSVQLVALRRPDLVRAVVPRIVMRELDRLNHGVNIDKRQQIRTAFKLFEDEQRKDLSIVHLQVSSSIRLDTVVVSIAVFLVVSLTASRISQIRMHKPTSGHSCRDSSNTQGMEAACVLICRRTMSPTWMTQSSSDAMPGSTITIKMMTISRRQPTSLQSRQQRPAQVPRKKNTLSC